MHAKRKEMSATNSQKMRGEFRWGGGGLGKLFSHMKANLCEVMSPAEATATYNFRRAGCKGKGSPQLEGILHPKEAAQPQERHLNNKDQQQQVV